MKDYSLYYTPPVLSSFLISKLSINSPDEAIDICCGSCNLLLAAKERWNSINLIGVDVLSVSPQSDIIVYQDDGRHYSIKTKKRYSLVLANPPFDKVKAFREYPQLYVGRFEAYRTNRLENEMLIANLRLLRRKGTLLIIVPSSFVEGCRNKELRRLVGNGYFIKRITKLHPGVFGAKHISCYVLEIVNEQSKGRSTELYTSKCCGEGIECVLSEEIENSTILSGNWIDSRVNLEKHLIMRRGNVSSSFFREMGVCILHTSKESEQWKPSIRFYNQNDITPSTFAEDGDIVVSRIGKSAGKWYRYRGERIPISDCLFCIKDPDGIIYGSINGRCESIRQHGVATRYITKEDIYQWYYLTCLCKY